MRRLHVVVGLLIVLLTPVGALASPLDSFTEGLSDLVHPVEGQKSDVVSYEQEFAETYQPHEVVMDRPVVRALPENATAVDYVNNTLNSYNSLPLGATEGATLLRGVMWLFGNPGATGSPFGVGLMAAVVGLVFMWWGLRKAIRMIVAAFKGRKLSV